MGNSVGDQFGMVMKFPSTNWVSKPGIPSTEKRGEVGGGGSTPLPPPPPRVVPNV